VELEEDILMGVGRWVEGFVVLLFLLLLVVVVTDVCV